jgi:hypothetical protein
MVYFQTKNPNLGLFWRALECKMLLYFITCWNIWWPFGIVCGHLVCIFSPFCMFGPRKIWQPCSSIPIYIYSFASTTLSTRMRWTLLRGTQEVVVKCASYVHPLQDSFLSKYYGTLLGFLPAFTQLPSSCTITYFLSHHSLSICSLANDFFFQFSK